MKKDFLLMLGILTVMIAMMFSADVRAEVIVNNDSIVSNGAVNQVVVVNPAPSVQPKVSRSTRPHPMVIHNHYYNDKSENCFLPIRNRGPVDPPAIMSIPVSPERFDYQDIWLIVISLLMAIGLGIFFGYLIWGRRADSPRVVIHSHGGRSSSSSRSGSSSESGLSTTLVGGPRPHQPDPAPSVQEEKK